MKSKIIYLLCLCLILANCSTQGNLSSQSTAQSTTQSSSQGTTSGEVVQQTDMFTARDKEIGYDEAQSISIMLSSGGATASDDAVLINGNVVTITTEGTYIVSGTLAEGQIIINAKNTDKIQLVLNNVNITCASSAALYVKQADKVFVTLANDSNNSLVTSAAFVAIDENDIDAAVFSKDDITFNGNGTLTVSASQGHGIVSKDDIVFTSGIYSVTSANTAVSGNDSVRIAAGDFTLTAGKDALHSENTDDTTLGFIYIQSGNFNLESGSDALDATGYLTVDDGVFVINATDDAFHADGALTINGGTIDIQSCKEGFEGQSVDVNEGIVNINATDDGINAASASTSATATPQRGGAMADSSCYIRISGGVININAAADGVDSNGNLYVTGGETYITAAENSGNSALDYDGEGQITAGIFVAAGSSGMAQNFGTNSTQGAILVNSQGSANDEIVLKSSNGNLIASYIPLGSYSSVLISAPQIVANETYTLTTGSQTQDIQTTSLIYGAGGLGGGNMGDRGNGGGGMAGGGMTPPDGTMTRPDDGTMTRPNGNMTPPDATLSNSSIYSNLTYDSLY